jgi:membrane fusion protein, multidrug efflux system
VFQNLFDRTRAALGTIPPRRRRQAVIAAVLLAAAALGGWFWQRLGHVEETDAQTAGEVATIASRVDGWLLVRPVMEGDRVKQGQVLGQLDVRDARLRLAALENGIAAQDAQIGQDEAQHVAAADAAVAAEAQADTARADFTRADALIKQKATSRESWDHARGTAVETAAAARQAQSQLAVLAQQTETARRQRAALVAQAAEVRQEIADRTLRAPFAGVIDRTFIHQGDYVQAGQWLMMLHDPADVWVEANIKETAVGKVKVGQPVAVTVDAYPGLRLRGHVQRVGNAATNQFALLPSPNPSGNFTKITQRVPVRIALDHPARPLQPGLMVEVSINVAH